MLRAILPQDDEYDNVMGYTLTETPLDCAVRVLMRKVPNRSWQYYRDVVQGILHDQRPDRTGVEHDVLAAYNRRVAQLRRSRREWLN